MVALKTRPTLPSMRSDALDSLTPRQRDCLRLVARDRSTKEIARILNISPDTVSNHVKAAMAILGVNSRFAAARLLSDHERSDLLQASPSRAIASPQYDMPIDHPTERQSVHDEPAALAASPRQLRQSGEKRYGLSIMQRLFCIVLLTVAIAIAIVAALPMSDSAQRFANWIEPRNHH